MQYLRRNTNMKIKTNKNTPQFKTVNESQPHKFRTKTHHFNNENGFSTRTRDAKQEKSEAKSHTFSYPTEARKANGTGKVQINVKNNKLSTEKKTGPLSPRAPEKIKKNRAEEMKIYGENACLSVFQQRPQAIVRLWATVEGAKKLADELSYLANQKKAYHIVDRIEMERVTGTPHHGDICLLVKKSTPFILEGYLNIPRKRDCLVLLDNIHNAQNIGGIMRTCAFYNVKGIIVENSDTLHASAAARVAEGGLEFIRPLESKHKEIALTQLRQAGYQIVHLTRNKQAPSLAKTTLAAKVVFVLNEIPTQDISYPNDTTVQLSFENLLNSSLNVTVSAGILLNQWYQTHLI